MWKTMTFVAEERERGIARSQGVRLGCRGPTWGHASRRNGSRRAEEATCQHNTKRNLDVHKTETSTFAEVARDVTEDSR